MGPRPLGRGKLAYGRQLPVGGPASMGPRPLGRGKCTASAAIDTVTRRVDGAAASRPRKAAYCRYIILLNLASMGPRPLGRGKVVGVYVADKDHDASMGPRPLGRGKCRTAACATCLSPRRRWGRGLSAAESWTSRRIRPMRSSVDGAAASRPRKAGSGAPPASSAASVDGAAASRPRKVEPGHRGGRYQIHASMGPRPLGRGKLAICEGRQRPLPASMGPRPLGRGKPEPPQCLPRRPHASMGPRPLGRGKGRDRP